ncbi:MAG: ABC transporter ATP-binding protein [Firmicutes bacterium]|nr:ABC transporter ATP-binding protein [Bacillota bacterium]
MIGEAGMDLLQPALMATIVDKGVLGIGNGGVGSMEIILKTGIQMVALIAAGGACGVLSGVFANLAAQNFGNDMRKDAFRHIMHFSFSQTDRFTTGSLITRVTNDVTQVQSMVSMVIRGFVRTIILFAGGIFFMLRLDLSFGVVVLCAMPMIILVLIFFLSRITPKFTVLQEKLDKVNNVMQENVTGSRVVKAYVQEEYEQGRFQKANDELVGIQMRILLLLNYMSPIMNIILNLSVIAVIWIGRIKVGDGSITPGSVMAAITYLSQILGALMRLGMMFQNISRGAASARRLQEVIDTEPEIRDGSFEGEPAVRGQVEFRDVYFAYPERDPILSGINLTIQPGETVGILGMTGSGKSSLVNLIPRFYDASEGTVLVDGVDVKDYRLKDLRRRIACSLQKSELFQDTIAGNISWGRPDASPEEIRHAAEIAQATEFIDVKESGMEEPVTQSGHSLSGGQKQRLSIARAVLKDAEILIFDDSTSALDLKTESLLYEALNREYPDKTKIIIAQRIASIKNADRILVLEDGRIAAEGRHEELLETSRIYREISDSQIGGESRG